MNRLKLKCGLIFMILNIFTGTLKSQDTQFSQYYTNPLYLNPALTGAGNNTRAMLHYRNQWPAASGKFITYSAAFDHFFLKAKSGVGAIILNDQQGLSGIVQSGAQLSYSYQLNLTNGISFRPGFQLGYFNRSFDFSQFSFNDQFDRFGPNGLATSETFNHNTAKYVDIGLGGILFTDRLWVGLSSLHVNQPNLSLMGGTDLLPMKFSLHAGYKFSLVPFNPYTARTGEFKDVSFTPSFMYKSQGNFDQFDIGGNLVYEPLLFGLWYRGIPIKQYDGKIQNNESIVFMAGVIFNGLQFVYSYDAVISSFAGYTGGAHELSLRYEFKWGKATDPWGGRQPRIMPPMRFRSIPCPKH